jgi:hypothetical protein
MVVDRKQDMFFVVLEQTPTERQRVQRTLKQLVYEALESSRRSGELPRRGGARAAFCWRLAA